jgi:N-acetylmuramoyl-L-alanine amidase
LQRLGLLPSPDPAPEKTDDFDEAVEAAVRGFQQDRGLTVDGIVGVRTFRRLEEARWSLGDRVLAYHPRHIIAGDDVATLQRRLSQFGFDLGRVDGRFGTLTDGALREFQRSVGVPPDGTCGPDTFRALTRLARTMGGTGLAHPLREQSVFEQSAGGPSGKVVVLDPGHPSTSTITASGSNASGSTAFTSSAAAAGLAGIDAGWLTADLAFRIEGRLAAIGVQVLLTRARDVETMPDEVERANFANDMSADLMLSLQFDTNPDPLANGLATFYYGDSIMGTGSVLGARAAQLIQREVTARTDLTDCRTHAKSWDILRLTRMPTVHIDCGYLTSPYDSVRLADPTFRDALAEGLAAAVVRFFDPDPSPLTRPTPLLVP